MTRAGNTTPKAIDLSPVRVLLDRIMDRWRPEQIWLFGSRARGVVPPTSDWDLLVVVPDDVPEADLDPVAAWRLQRDSGVYADVVLCRASEFAEDRATPNTLAFEAAVAGVLVHER